MTAAELRLQIRSCLLERDQDGLSRLMVSAAFDRVMLDTEIDAEAIANEELDKLDHDTQLWWLGDCNCDGHLN